MFARLLQRSVHRASIIGALVAFFGMAGSGLAGCSPEPGAQSQGHSSEAFPAAGDLAFIAPLDDAPIRAVDVMPSAWLDAVVEALEQSELGENIDDENWREDWRLVSARFVPCSPLGKVADPARIDALCWPQVRLVWQPVVTDIRIFGINRPHYADDRAIHALYRLEPSNPALVGVLDALEQNVQVPESLFTTFAAERDRLGRELLDDLQQLRLASSGYASIDVRPELYDAELSDAFYQRFVSFLDRYASAEALHELTAFSLPLGRNPASSDLWSFVAFAGRDGRIEPIPLGIHDAHSGQLLFSFPSSEDVSTGLGDGELLDALSSMPPERADRLLEQVITDTNQLATHAARINDPYQTLVANTSCSSCHRMNNLNFNFHNLSYLEDHEVTVAPRVRRDVERDLGIARKLRTSGY